MARQRQAMQLHFSGIDTARDADDRTIAAPFRTIDMHRKSHLAMVAVADFDALEPEGKAGRRTHEAFHLIVKRRLPERCAYHRKSRGAVQHRRQQPTLPGTRHRRFARPFIGPAARAFVPIVGHAPLDALHHGGRNTPPGELQPPFIEQIAGIKREHEHGVAQGSGATIVGDLAGVVIRRA
ncbi:hypothetical protein WK13_22060 [Burkholderia ubonensis]|nr:hypothetical protein WK13_22060 [Burkholderia ubonensis]